MEVEKYFPRFLAFIDSTEQQIPRPINNRDWKLYYSGKKKRHTVKTQLMVNNRGYILIKLSIRKENGMITIFTKRIILLSFQNKLLL
ncbi:MAG TPA: transposase family protein [Candidatus Nitrosocosmicus sp.]